MSPLAPKMTVLASSQRMREGGQLLLFGGEAGGDEPGSEGFGEEHRQPAEQDEKQEQ